MNSQSLQQAYAYCQAMAHHHYENFPVASLLLPRRLRAAVAVIYAFARSADDIADEGPGDARERLLSLHDYRLKLEQCARHEAMDDPVFIALADVIERYHLPLQLLHDLISAFSQDLGKRRYSTFSELHDYCRRSADPVGRLLLHLTGNASEFNLRLSDQICTSLQLINFLQDIEQDYRENDRIYIPLDEMARFGIDESWFAERRSEAAMRSLLALQIARAHQMMVTGASLGERLKGRFGLEIRLIVQGGLRTLEKLEQQRDDLFSRPRLNKSDLLLMVLRAL